MQMSSRYVRCAPNVVDDRSRDHHAERSSVLGSCFWPLIVRRSIAPSVVGTPAPHAAATYRASGLVLWRKADKTVVASIRLAGGCEGLHDLVDAVRVVHRLTVYLACVFRKTLPKCTDRYAPIVQAPATSARQEGFGPITTGYIERT